MCGTRLYRTCVRVSGSRGAAGQRLGPGACERFGRLGRTAAPYPTACRQRADTGRFRLSSARPSAAALIWLNCFHSSFNPCPCLPHAAQLLSRGRPWLPITTADTSCPCLAPLLPSGMRHALPAAGGGPLLRRLPPHTVRQGQRAGHCSSCRQAHGVREMRQASWRGSPFVEAAAAVAEREGVAAAVNRHIRFGRCASISCWHISRT